MERTDMRIGNNVKIYDNVDIGENTIIGDNVILGHPTGAYYKDKNYKNLRTVIGKNCTIRANSIIYCGVIIGDGSQTGTGTVIRERCTFGINNVIGTLTQVENDTIVGDNTFIQTCAHITANMKIGNDVFIGPHVISCNDNKILRIKDVKAGVKTELIGPTIKDGARLGSGAMLLPGVVIGEDCMIGVGSVVTKNVPSGETWVGNPAKLKKKVKENE